jgi:hypothetical protein
VAAGLGEGLARNDEAGRLDQALLLRLDQGVGGAAEVAHRCEAAVEHALHDAGGAIGDERIRNEGVLADIHHGGDDVDVAVDEARHERALAAVHDLGLGSLDRLVGELPDLVALDEKLVALDQFVGDGRIQQAEVAEQGQAHGVVLGGRRSMRRSPSPDGSPGRRLLERPAYPQIHQCQSTSILSARIGAYFIHVRKIASRDRRDALDLDVEGRRPGIDTGAGAGRENLGESVRDRAR